MKLSMRMASLVLCLMCIMAFASPTLVYAANGLDELAGQSQGPNSNQTGGQQATGDTQSGGNQAIEDYLKGYNPVTGENMEKAATVASPIVSAIGTLSGFIIMIVSAAIFLVTALDLCYIALPFMRGLLNPGYAAGGAAGGAMGGMPMGGMGMGMRGGMGMGGMPMGGGAAPMGEHGLRRKWVSDEAVYCVQTYAMGGQAAAGGMAGGMMGGGMMGGGMGMPGMGAMGGAQPQQMPMKSVIFEYLKKRSFFLIIFAIATVILMSSLFTDCGLNLAALLSKVINKLSGQVSNVNF